MSERNQENQASPEISALTSRAEDYYRNRLGKPQFFNLTPQALSQDMNTQAGLVQDTAEMIRENNIQVKFLQLVVDRLHPGLLPVAKAYASVTISSDRDGDFEAYQATSKQPQNPLKKSSKNV